MKHDIELKLEILATTRAPVTRLDSVSRILFVGCCSGRRCRLTPPGRSRSTGVVGAALATSRPAVALVGDGSMLMLNEVSTAVATGAPAIWVILNDSRYNMCAQGAQVLGLTDVDCSLPETDFAAYARSLGAAGVTVRRADELDGAPAAALGATGPVVVDVHIDPRAGAPHRGPQCRAARDGAADGTR